MPIFFTLSQANAQKLQDVAGGDEARVNFLTTALGLQLVGRAGLNAAQQDLLKVNLIHVQYLLMQFCHHDHHLNATSVMLITFC